MGLFSFIKDAGAVVFGVGKTAAREAREANEERTEEMAAAAAREAEEDQRAIEHMSAVMGNMGLEVQDLNITIDNDVATVTGLAKNQATREKIILVVGNTTGIAGVDDRLEVEYEAPQAVFYTVEGGDSLSKIAKKVYGDPMKYPIIFEANQPMLVHPDKIYPGQVLRIPNLDQ